MTCIVTLLFNWYGKLVWHGGSSEYRKALRSNQRGSRSCCRQTTGDRHQNGSPVAQPRAATTTHTHTHTHTHTSHKVISQRLQPRKRTGGGSTPELLSKCARPRPQSVASGYAIAQPFWFAALSSSRLAATVAACAFATSSPNWSRGADCASTRWATYGEVAR